MTTILLLLIFHIIGDFYLQSNRLAKCKESRIDEECKDCDDCSKNKIKSFNFKKLLIHVLIYLIPFVVVFPFTFILDEIYVGDIDYLIAIFIIGLTHIGIDALTLLLRKRMKKSVAFLIDQLLHYLVILVIANYYISISIDILEDLHLAILLSTLVLIRPSSIFISVLYSDIFKEEVSIGGTGAYIGIFERLIIGSLLLINAPAVITIVIAAKTLVRYNEIKKDEENFQTKYLIGTLASIAIPLICFVLIKLFL